MLRRQEWREGGRMGTGGMGWRISEANLQMRGDHGRTFLRLYGISTLEYRTMAQICGPVSWIFSVRGAVDAAETGPGCRGYHTFFSFFFSFILLFPFLHLALYARLSRHVAMRQYIIQYIDICVDILIELKRFAWIIVDDIKHFTNVYCTEIQNVYEREYHSLVISTIIPAILI